MAMLRRVFLLLVALCAVTGCSADSPPSRTPSPVARTTPSATAAPSGPSWNQAQPPASCSVTQPDPKSVPPAPIDPDLKPVPWADHWHGNASLWTRLPRTGVVPVHRGEAGLHTKFPWWRLEPGNLSVTAARSAGGGRFAATFPPSGYGRTGFVPSELIFSAEGCWRVSASSPTKQPLVFVIWVQEFAI